MYQREEVMRQEEQRLHELQNKIKQFMDHLPCQTEEYKQLFTIMQQVRMQIACISEQITGIESFDVKHKASLFMDEIRCQSINQYIFDGDLFDLEREQKRKYAHEAMTHKGQLTSYINANVKIGEESFDVRVPFTENPVASIEKEALRIYQQKQEIKQQAQENDEKNHMAEMEK